MSEQKMRDMAVFVDRDGSFVDAAARIWAEATAARDGDDEIAPLDLARPVIARVLALSGGVLVVASLSREPAGFAAVSDAQGPDRSVAEVHYLGVQPSFAGQGVARALLTFLAGELKSRGFDAALLKVYVDNARAVRLYESTGWRRHGAPSPHPRSGRLEQEYRLEL